MGFFDFFRKHKLSEHVVAAADKEAITETTDTRIEPADKKNIITITYGTGMPIDAIYAFLDRDYEQEGYKDALTNADAEYCKAKEAIILNNLRQLFQRVLLRYSQEIRQLNVKIENMKSLFAITSASALEARKVTCDEHIAEINRMTEKLEAQSPEMMTMIDSYRRGFTKGIAAQTVDFLKTDQNIA